MVIRVLFFGPARTAAGVATCTVTLDGPSTIDGLIEQLRRRYPALGGLGESLRFAVNEAFVVTTCPLNDQDEVAVIPPVSGGSGPATPAPGGLIALSDSTIDAAGALSRVTGDGRLGGVVWFLGVTRAQSHPRHGELLGLEYQAYEAMARKQMHELAAAAQQRWPVVRAALVHRVGKVAIGETSVLIGVACPHRAEAFEACRWLIDELKRQVPIWKCEHWSDGAATWSRPELDASTSRGQPDRPAGAPTHD